MDVLRKTYSSVKVVFSSWGMFSYLKNVKSLFVLWCVCFFYLFFFSIGDHKDVTIAELQEQLRDVMFYLETQQRIEHLPPEARSEIQEGQINIAAGPADAAPGSAGTGPSSGRGRRGRGRKRK